MGNLCRLLAKTQLKADRTTMSEKYTVENEDISGSQSGCFLLGYFQLVLIGKCHGRQNGCGGCVQVAENNLVDSDVAQLDAYYV